VRRFLKHLGAECSVTATAILYFPPADAAQVDFGAGPALIHESGHALKTWFFVMTMLDAPTVRRTRVRSDRRAVADLSPARLRVVRLLPGRIIVDNAMCAIIRACMYDLEVQRSYAGLAEGYGFRTCPPHDPQKKSVFESGVKYIKKSFMPLRTLLTCRMPTGNCVNGSCRKPVFVNTERNASSHWRVSPLRSRC
jgi:hypothetical protein